MTLRWYQQNQEVVAEAVRRKERPDLATTMSSGPLDDLVSLHDELEVFAALGEMTVERQRAGIEDALLLRTLATLPFIEHASFAGVTELLFKQPAILLHLGWSALQICCGDNERHRSGDRRQAESLPCSLETLRDELQRISESEWLKAQQRAVQQLFERGLVRGRVYAIDGTGLGNDWRLVCLVCVSVDRPVIVAWRLLHGPASEKGKEAAVTRSLIEQAIAVGGEGCIELLLVDALYADGPLLAWCKYQQQIDVLVPLPSDREIHRDLEQLAAAEMLAFERYSYLRTIQGHKQRRTLEFGVQKTVTGWDSFIAAARAAGDENPSLWACLIRPLDAQNSEDVPWTLASTRTWPCGAAAFQAFRPRWHIENDAYRELKEGWGLEAQRWGRHPDVQRGRVHLTCLAFNTAQVYLTRAGEKLAARGIRRLRRHYDRWLGHSPVVLYYGRYFGVFPVEQLLALVGVPTYQSLLPACAAVRPP